MPNVAPEQRPVRRIAGARFSERPDAEGGYAAHWPGGSDVTVMVTFQGPAYPFELHCRYASMQSPLGENVFSNLRFGEAPPGLRVGPWPGWRGIPEMPRATLRFNDASVPLAYQWWGDELTRRNVRAICRVRGKLDPDFSVHVQDQRLVPAEVEFYDAPELMPRPSPIGIASSSASRHPRLLVRTEDLPRLQLRMPDTIQAFLPVWETTLQPSAESKISPGPELLSDEDRLLISAYIALLTPDTRNLDRATAAFTSYLQRTRDPGFAPLTIDTQAGEVLFLLCVAYDWLKGAGARVDEREAEIRLGEIAGICWGHMGYDRRDYGQAHFLGCGLGLLAFSLLFSGVHPRSREWSAYLHGVIRAVCGTLPVDGFYPHGLNMWIYESSFLLRWLELIRTAGETDLWPEAEALAASSRFRGAATSPDGLFGITMGDPQYRVGGDAWCHYLIAARTGSSAAQRLGDRLSDLPVAGVDFRLAPPRRRVYEHLWHNPDIPAGRVPERISVFHDGGQVFVRGEQSLFTFRSGAPLGEHRYAAGLTGAYGHADPCHGSFLLSHEGELVLSGPGPVYRRDSTLHNIVTIDGQGQIGDSAVWLPDFFPPGVILSRPEILVTGDALTIRAELAAAYLPHLGVKRLSRSMVVDAEKSIEGVDRVVLDEVRTIEWNLHSWRRFARLEHDGGNSWVLGEASSPNFEVHLRSPEAVAWETGKSPFVPAYPNDGREGYVLRASIRAREAEFVWTVIFPGDR